MPSPHSCTQGLQSNGQVEQLSPGPQMPSPQVDAQPPQSAQVTHVSPPSQWLLPQWLQPRLQREDTSFTQIESQPPEQQKGSSELQICATHGSHVETSGKPWSQSGCAHVPQVPQSAGQVAQLSPATPSQRLSPQSAMHALQSCGHV